jgi:hypothetical protein
VLRGRGRSGWALGLTGERAGGAWGDTQRTSLPLLIQGLQQHLEQAEAMHEASSKLPSPHTPQHARRSNDSKASGTPGWQSSRDRVAYLQQALAAAEKAASQRMAALEGRLAKAEVR